MFEVTAHADIAASPERIWRMLTDFAHYQEWHPFAAITGVAIAGAEIDYTFKILAAKLGSSGIRMKIVRCEPPSCVAWRFGVAGMMWFEEWYGLDARAKGTRVEQGMRFSDPLSWPTKPILVKKVAPILQTSVRALADRLAALQPS